MHDYLDLAVNGATRAVKARDGMPAIGEPMPDDPRDARIRDLEAALDYVAGEARAGSHALCAHELQMRLENIARKLEEVRNPQGRTT